MRITYSLSLFVDPDTQTQPKELEALARQYVCDEYPEAYEVGLAVLHDKVPLTAYEDCPDDLKGLVHYIYNVPVVI